MQNQPFQCLMQGATPHDKHTHNRRELGSERPNGGYSEGSPAGDESSIYSERAPPTIFKLLNKT